jgi:hypothetical protein
MASVDNVQVYGLEESIWRSSYPMLKTAPTKTEFDVAVYQIKNALLLDDPVEQNDHIKRAIKLANAKGGGHDQFLTGITVTFDLTLSNKAWVEAERYTFLNFVSSMSTIHRVAHFKIGECCNKYTNKGQIEIVEAIQQTYLDIPDSAPEAKKEIYLTLLYNLPSGFELMSGMITNYRCLKNIYYQRRTHKLPDWHVVCDWIETLPLGRELICGGGMNE